MVSTPSTKQRDIHMCDYWVRGCDCCRVRRREQGGVSCHRRWWWKRTKGKLSASSLQRGTRHVTTAEHRTLTARNAPHEPVPQRQSSGTMIHILKLFSSARCAHLSPLPSRGTFSVSPCQHFGAQLGVSAIHLNSQLYLVQLPLAAATVALNLMAVYCVLLDPP